MQRIYKYLGGAALLLGAIFGFGFFFTSQASKKTLTVALCPDYPGICARQFGKGSAYEGMEIEILEEVANQMKLEIKYTPLAFELIPQKVNSGEYEVGGGGFTDNNNNRSLHFSIPYEKNQLMITHLSNIPLEKAIIGVQRGSTCHNSIEEEGIKLGQIKTYSSFEEVMSALDNKSIQGFAADGIVVRNYVAVNKKFVSLVFGKKNSNFVFIVSPKLLGEFNKVLKEVLSKRFSKNKKISSKQDHCVGKICTIDISIFVKWQSQLILFKITRRNRFLFLRSLIFSYYGQNE